MKTAFRLLYFFAAFLSLYNLAEASGVKIEVRPESFVSSSRVTLGDIADVSGENRTEVNRINAVFLTSLPPKAQSKSLSKGLITSMLKRNRIDVDEMNFTSPETVRITGERVIVEAKDILEMGREHLEEILLERSSNAVIKSINYTGGDLSLPKGELTFEFLPLNRSHLAGPVSLHANIFVDGKLVERVEIKANVEVTLEIIKAVRSIRKGEIVSEEDLIIKRKSVKKENPNWFTDPRDVIGMRAKRPISANSTLQANMLELPPLVKKKDRVKIIIESKYLKISTVGIAKENGVKGSYIRVMNLDSKKIIVARVVEENLVKVDF